VIEPVHQHMQVLKARQCAADQCLQTGKLLPLVGPQTVAPPPGKASSIRGGKR
jgi:hypothetical protein